MDKEDPPVLQEWEQRKNSYLKIVEELARKLDALLGRSWRNQDGWWSSLNFPHSLRGWTDEHYLKYINQMHRMLDMKDIAAALQLGPQEEEYEE